MTPDEEFDAAAQAAEEMLSQYPPEDIKEPSAIRSWLDGLNPTLWRADAGVNAGRIAQDIAASIKVLIVTKLLSNDDEKQQFAHSIEVLQAEYFIARNNALASTAARYTITSQLRDQTGALNMAYKKIKSNAAALNQLGDLVDGLASLIRALK